MPTYQEAEALIRYSSKVPAFQIESSDTADTATGKSRFYTGHKQAVL